MVSPGRAHIVKWVVVLGVVLRATIPIGYMPDFSALRDGSWPITLCATGIIGKLDLPHAFLKEGSHSSDEHKGSVCDFAVIAALAASTSEAAVEPPVWPRIGFWRVPAQTVGRGLEIASLWNARAPPIS